MSDLKHASWGHNVGVAMLPYPLLSVLFFLNIFLHWSGFVENCSRVLGQSCNILHPLNVAMTAVREQLMRGQLTLQQWEAALDNGEILTQAYRYHLIYTQGLVGVFLFVCLFFWKL